MLVLTVKTLTSLLFRTSSTRPSGLPFGMGMVPRMVKEEPSSVCLTDLMKDWLKSSILPISSMTNTFLLPPCAAPTWRRWLSELIMTVDVVKISYSDSDIAHFLQTQGNKMFK